MNPFVLIQMTLVSKTPVAIITLESLHPCMSYFMLVQISFVPKTLATLVAFKTFLW